MARWLLWAYTALGSWGLWAILSKLIGDALSPAHSQALSTLGFLPVLIALVFVPGAHPNGSTLRGTWLAVVAGLVTSLGNLTYYAALQRGEKAVTVIPLTALYPVVTIALAVVVLHERLGGYQRVGVLLSLAATYLFNVQTEAGLLSDAVVHALPPIALWGVSGLLQKISTHHISGERSALWFLAAAVPVSAAILIQSPLDYHGVTPRTWTLAIALGFFFALGNFAILAAFASQGGKASVISPLGGLYPLVSIPIAVLFLGESVSRREFVGIALAIASVCALAREPAPIPAVPASPASPTG